MDEPRWPSPYGHVGRSDTGQEKWGSLCRHVEASALKGQGGSESTPLAVLRSRRSLGEGVEREKRPPPSYSTEVFFLLLLPFTTKPVSMAVKQAGPRRSVRSGSLVQESRVRSVPFR